MTNPQKAKGDRAERTVRDWLRDNGFPDCERTRAGYTRDAGDLHPCRGITVQVKDRAAYAWPHWMQQLAEQRAEAKADHALLVLKRRGLGNAGEWLAVMPLEAMAELLKAAGYGVITDSAQIWPEHGDTARIALPETTKQTKLEAAHASRTAREEVHQRVEPHGTSAQETQVPHGSPSPDDPSATGHPDTGLNMSLDDKRLVSIAKGAKYLGVSTQNIYDRFRRGELTRYQVGDLSRVDLNELDALVTSDRSAS